MIVAGFCRLAGLKTAPLSRSSTRSPATAPVPERLTRKSVAVAASAALSQPPVSFVEPCSAGVLGAEGATTFFVKASAVLSGPVEFLSVSRAVSDLAPLTPRSAPATVNST